MEGSFQSLQTVPEVDYCGIILKSREFPGEMVQVMVDILHTFLQGQQIKNHLHHEFPPF